MIAITVNTKNGIAKQVGIEAIPDKCPLCHKHLVPNALGYFLIDGQGLLQGMYRCTNGQCGRLFVGDFRASQGGLSAWYLESLAPNRVQPPDLPDEIKNVSPSFVDVMGQVAVAEQFKLTQLVGVGLRKALEFLAKDFAISKRPADEDEIKRRFLGDVIKEYIDDTRVKSLAERAVWLGNDETHYVRKWEDKDITHLHSLVRLTVNAIVNIIEGDKVIADMQPKPKK